MTPLNKATVERHFVAYANVIGLHVNGLQGLSIYRDSSFDLEWRKAGFPEELRQFARETFNREVDERVVRKFPNHPLTKFSIERLKNAEEATV